MAIHGHGAHRALLMAAMVHGRVLVFAAPEIRLVLRRADELGRIA